MMKIAIVFDSRTGKTRRAAEEMGEIARAEGHECSVQSVKEADPAVVGAADAICIGSWTEGLLFILQHATSATMKFIGTLDGLDGRPAAVFCTYWVATGKMLPKMADSLRARGANVTGLFRSRGATAAEGFREWVQALKTAG